MDRHARGLARVIAVIGGGWAGCAAAVELAQHGFRVELYEAAATLGGRARAVLRHGLTLDNGEHLLLGAYTDTLKLSAVLHAGEPISPWATAPLAIRPYSPQQRNALAFRARNLPAPIGMMGGIFCASGLSSRERIATIRWFVHQRRAGFRCPENATVAELLADLPSRPRDGLLAPLCLAALNTPPARASAQVFLNVLREAFGATSSAARMMIPRHGLGAAIPERAVRWLRARGHLVHVSSPVRVAAIGEGVRLSGAASETRIDAAIVAVGPHQLAAAFDATARGADPRIAAAIDSVGRFSWEPITTAYLGYATPVALPSGLVRLDDAPGQWLFDRGDILARAIPAPARPELRALLSVVISAHGEHRQLDGGALVAAIDAQLRRLSADLPPLAWSQVIAEQRATYACVPALKRPACGPLAGGIYLAGDYTYAAFPSTLEAAVRSGVLAARAVMLDLPM